MYLLGSAPGDTVADRVFGQVSLNGSGCNQSGPTPNPGDTFPTSASTLCHSRGVAIDSASHLYVVDQDNNRVLEYDNPMTSSVADRVFGQGGSFTNGPAGGTCNVGGVSASSLCNPTGVAVDAAGRLYIADLSNSRVLEYDSPLTCQVADRVFGQGGSFTTGTCNGINASSLCGPGSVAVDAAGHLYVSDARNHRVLEFDSPMTSSTAN